MQTHLGRMPLWLDALVLTARWTNKHRTGTDDDTDATNCLFALTPGTVLAIALVADG